MGWLICSQSHKSEIKVSAGAATLMLAQSPIPSSVGGRIHFLVDYKSEAPAFLLVASRVNSRLLEDSHSTLLCGPTKQIKIWMFNLFSEDEVYTTLAGHSLLLMG